MFVAAAVLGQFNPDPVPCNIDGYNSRFIDFGTCCGDGLAFEPEHGIVVGPSLLPESLLLVTVVAELLATAAESLRRLLHSGWLRMRWHLSAPLLS